MIRKGFLAPTVMKLAMALLVFLLFVPFISHDNGIRCIKAPCPSVSTSPASIYFLFYPQYQIYEFQYVTAAIGLAVSYLVSCAIALRTARVGN